MNDEIVSIIMPAYNASSTIRESILSVCKQSYVNWELIIVDDCSNDSTINVIQDKVLSDERIKLIRLQENSGSPAVPRNTGIESAIGRYIAFLDADDKWESCKLESQLSFMTINEDCVISYTGYTVIDSEGMEIGGFLPPTSVSYEDLLRENVLGCLTVMFDTKAIGKHFFPTCGHEDYALWLEILKSGVIAKGMPESLAFYRVQSDSVSSNKLKVLKFFWNIYRDQEKFSRLISAYYCVRYAWNTRSKYGKRNVSRVNSG